MSYTCKYCPCWAYLLCVDVDCLKRGYGSINWTPELSVCRMKLRDGQINLDSLLLFDLFNRFLQRHLEPHRGSSTSHPSSTSSLTKPSLRSALAHCALQKLMILWAEIHRACSWPPALCWTRLIYSAGIASLGHDSTSDPFGVKFDLAFHFKGSATGLSNLHLRVPTRTADVCL